MKTWSDRPGSVLLQPSATWFGVIRHTSWLCFSLHPGYTSRHSLFPARTCIQVPVYARPRSLRLLCIYFYFFVIFISRPLERVRQVMRSRRRRLCWRKFANCGGVWPPKPSRSSRRRRVGSALRSVSASVASCACIASPRRGNAAATCGQVDDAWTRIRWPWTQMKVRQAKMPKAAIKIRSHRLVP